jgi:hypothetical protein
MLYYCFLLLSPDAKQHKQYVNNIWVSTVVSAEEKPLSTCTHYGLVNGN